MRFQDFARGFFVVVLIFALLYVGRDLLIPLVLAFFLWYLINTLRALFERIRLRGRPLPGWLSLLLSALAILGVMGFMLDLITRNLAQVVKAAPQYQVNLNGLIGRAYLLAGIENAPPRIEQFFAGLDLSALLTTTAGTLAGFAGQTGFIILLMFFIFLEQKYFRAKLLVLLPGGEDHRDTLRLIERIDADVKTYIGVKSLVSATTAQLDRWELVYYR